jgi:Flp pilus assembly protein TadG
MISRIQALWKKKDGGIAIEAVIFFPILLTMLFGVFDVGRAITANHKMIIASQVMADLITRGPSVTTSDIDDAISAGVLAMYPYASSAGDFGVDVVSIRFDSSNNPAIVWRDTRNMAADDDAVTRSEGLGTTNEGVVAVTMLYDYKPVFGGVLISSYYMRETAYARGRRTSVVTHD